MIVPSELLLLSMKSQFGDLLSLGLFSNYLESVDFLGVLGNVGLQKIRHQGSEVLLIWNGLPLGTESFVAVLVEIDLMT